MVGLLVGGAVVVCVVGVALFVYGRAVRNGPGSSGPGRSPGAEPAAIPLVSAVSDYVKRSQQVQQFDGTEAQREAALSSARSQAQAQFKEAVSKCGVVSFDSAVTDVAAIRTMGGGETGLWRVSMRIPKGFEALPADVQANFWLNMSPQEALSIKKGDPISIRGAISSAGPEPYCLKLVISTKNSERLFSIGETTAIVIGIPISDTVVCSVGSMQFRPTSERRFMLQDEVIFVARRGSSPGENEQMGPKPNVVARRPGGNLPEANPAGGDPAVSGRKRRPQASNIVPGNPLSGDADRTASLERQERAEEVRRADEARREKEIEQQQRNEVAAALRAIPTTRRGSRGVRPPGTRPVSPYYRGPRPVAPVPQRDDTPSGDPSVSPRGLSAPA